MKRLFLAALFLLPLAMALAQQPLLLNEIAAPGLPPGVPLVGPPTCTLPNGCNPVPGTTGPIRNVLTTATTYFIRPAGSDTNCTGLTNADDPGSGLIPRPCAFATGQKAINIVTNTVDLGGQTVTIQFADPSGVTTYTGCNNWGVSTVGGGVVFIQGDSAAPSNVIISTTNCDAFSWNASSSTIFRLRYLKITATGTSVTGGSATGLNLNAPVVIFWSDVAPAGSNFEFGSTAGGHVSAGVFSTATQAGDDTISGGAPWHLITSQGKIYNVGHTSTLTGTPAFSQAFAYSTRLGLIDGTGCGFSGAATGTRYYVDFNAVINTLNGGPNCFPGSVAGFIGNPPGEYF